MLYLYVFLLSDTRSIWFWMFPRSSLLLFVVWRVPRILVFTVLSIGFPNFTNVVQLLCSLSGWLHLNFSSIGTGFNGTETNCRIVHNLGIMLMNSNQFAIFFSSILVMSAQISIWILSGVNIPLLTSQLREVLIWFLLLLKKEHSPHTL